MKRTCKRKPRQEGFFSAFCPTRFCAGMESRGNRRVLCLLFCEDRETYPEKPEKGEPGCVLGAGGRCGRCGRVSEPEILTKVNHIAIQRMKKGNRRKPSVFAGFVAGAEGLVSPAGSGAASRWGAPSTVRGGSRDRHRSLRTPGARSPLGTRFWSGCGKKTEEEKMAEQRGLSGRGRRLRC